MEKDAGIRLNAAVAENLSKGQAKRLLVKTDLVVLPLAVLSMTLAFLDKVYRKLLFVDGCLLT